MLEHSEKLGLGKIATGHYAKIEYDNSSGKYLLRKAKDLHRDQSYVLYMLNQEILSRIEFPLGDMTKPEVRELAASLNFSNSKKHDSQDICFIPDGNYAAFIEGYTGKKYPEGDFVNPNGKILGRHKGIIYYTVGQRKGLGISNPKPLFVLRIDAGKNEIVVTEKEHLFSEGLEGAELNLLDDIENPNEFKALVKIRQKHKECPATVSILEGGRFKVVFETPQLSVTPGQAVAIYREDGILQGGGIIEKGF